MEYGKWDMEYGIWDMEYGIWNMEYGIWNMGYGIWNMGNGKWKKLVYSITPFFQPADREWCRTILFSLERKERYQYCLKWDFFPQTGQALRLPDGR